ncbi:hypothetical protein PG997_002045 [Apiospora hydei]|uniref:Uncharacterized protein n=1 Tax=Apiospora hydei TaxID=1337664 RepID=A0ABR1X8D0_9PEZI
MAPGPTITTIPSEVRLVIYKHILQSELPEADEFFFQPAYTLVVNGTSPFKTYEPPAGIYSPWSLLRLCKLVRAELQPLLDALEKNRHLVIEFQNFQVRDMRAWAAAAGEARVAAMRGWALSTIIECGHDHMGYGMGMGLEDGRGSETESEGEQPHIEYCCEHMWRGYIPSAYGEGDDDQDAEEGDGDSDEADEVFVDMIQRFHCVNLQIDLNRLVSDGKSDASSSGLDEDEIYEYWWGGDWRDDCDACKGASACEASEFIREELLQGTMQPKVTGEILCSMLQNLSQNAHNSKSRRKDWAMFQYRVENYGYYVE